MIGNDLARRGEAGSHVSLGFQKINSAYPDVSAVYNLACSILAISRFPIALILFLTMLPLDLVQFALISLQR